MKLSTEFLGKHRPKFNAEFKESLGSLFWIMPAAGLLGVLTCVILAHMIDRGVAYFIGILCAVCVFPAAGILLFPTKRPPT